MEIQKKITCKTSLSNFDKIHSSVGKI